jgi:hypothetical protein
LINYVNIKRFCLKNQTKAQKIIIPAPPVIIKTHLKVQGSSNNSIGMFMPKTPVTTPKIATTNVAVVKSNSNFISWFRTLSWFSKFKRFSSKVVKVWNLTNVLNGTTHYRICLNEFNSFLSTTELVRDSRTLKA